MAYTTIDNPGLFFNTVLYTGDDATTRNITGFGFQPDFIWNKARSAAYNHYLVDAVRGSPGKVLISNLTNAEDNDSGFQNSFKGFVADGNTIGQQSGYEVNDSGVTYVQWGWKAGGSASSNSNGSITSTVSANTTAGFSIVSYTGNLTADATVGHGLGVAPSMIIIKNRTDSADWFVFHQSLTSNNSVKLNTTDAEFGGAYIFDSTTSSFKLRDHNVVNGNGDNLIAYCFAEKKGYSKFGSYTGNGSTNGTFVYTGFKPAFFLWKKTSSTGNWLMMDNKRSTFNFAQTYVKANANAPEDATSSDIRWDFLSNGLKCRGDNSSINSSGATYIFMAFAESPFVTAGTKAPGTAR